MSHAGNVTGGTYADRVLNIVDSNDIVVFSKTSCGYCSRAKSLLNRVASGKHVKVIELDQMEDGRMYQNALAELTGRRTVPNIYIHRKNVGGCDDLYDLHERGKLSSLL